MKNFNQFLLLLGLTLLLIGCKKDKHELSLENVKYNNNKTSYPSANMDSAQAINAITKQKVQEVIDLSILYSSGKKDTEIDSAMYSQLQGYFFEADSTTLQPLLKELDSFKVRAAKVHSLNVYEKIHENDTLNFARFEVEYFSAQNKSLAKKQREAQYILVSSPKQFKKEFKFFFLDFYRLPIKDSTALGVTR